MPPEEPTFLTLLRDSVNRVVRVLDELAKEKADDTKEFMEWKIEIEKRFSAIETSIAVSNVKLMLYGSIGGTIGASIIGTIIYSIFSQV